MKLSIVTGTVAGLLALAAPAIAAPTVTVRVEGANSTLLERTTVTLGSEGVPGTSCAADSAGAALDAATKGNWNRGEFVSTIFGETHAYPNPDYWAEWVDKGSGYKRGGGVCADHLSEGDELLMIVDYATAPTYAPVVFPLDLEGAPATATAGSKVTVTVVEYRSATGNTGEGDRTPVAGATVTGGAAPVTTDDASGNAVVRLETPGTVVLKATKPGDAPSAGEQVTVVAPGARPGTPAPATADRTPPKATLAGLRDHQVLSRGPRELRGSFSDSSGVSAVKLRLTKRLGRRCWYFSGRLERFRGTRCGRGPYFAIGDRADWSYLLPARLGKGRYVLDAVAIDAAGNRTPLARGTTRVVFIVR